MKISKFNDWTTLLSNFGVILGIVFLATQLQQTNELMESERRYNRLQVVLDGTSPYFENQALVEALLKTRDGQELSDSEKFLVDFQLSNVLSSWQWTWVELRDSEEFPLEQYKDSMQRNKYFQNLWEERKSLMLPEFVEFVEENILPR